MTNKTHDDLTDTIEVAEQRAFPRVGCRLQVRIEGIDDKPIERIANLSTGGLHIITDHAPGRVGDLTLLYMNSTDLRAGASTVAKLVRMIELDQGDGLINYGTAFQFMPGSDRERSELDELFRWVLTDQVNSGDLSMVQALPVDLEPTPSLPTPPFPAPAQAQVRELTVSRLLVETSWPLHHGDRVQIIFRAFQDETRLPFHGVVAESAPNARGYFQSRVDVLGFGEDEGWPADESPTLSHSIDLILSDMMQKGALPTDRQTLSGELKRLPLMSLLGLVVSERMTGKLRFQDGDEEAQIFLLDGDVVHVIPETNAVKLLASWIGREKGSFAFSAEPIVLEDDWLTRSMQDIIKELNRRL